MILIRAFRTLDHYSVSVAWLDDAQQEHQGLAARVESLAYTTFPDLPDDEPERLVEQLRSALECADPRVTSLGGWERVL